MSDQAQPQPTYPDPGQYGMFPIDIDWRDYRYWQSQKDCIQDEELTQNTWRALDAVGGLSRW